MEDIRDHYSYPLEEAIIVENVDNCIDELYTEIRFKKSNNKLEILMLGDGVTPEHFWSTLPKIAATSKVGVEGKKALGRYGWGMKVIMCVSEGISIETKKGDFHAAQYWKLVEGKPMWKEDAPVKKIDKDFTAITMDLNDEYSKRITEESIEKTLQEYYPTMLGGTRVKDKNGNRRRLKAYVSSKLVKPPAKKEWEKKKPLNIKSEGEEASGYVYLTKEKLQKRDVGIAIIVHGRKITREFFGVYTQKNTKVTGYLHADVLVRDLAGDKTKLKRASSRWRYLSKETARQLTQFMKEIGAIREGRLPRKTIKLIHEEINNLIKHFPELQELAIKPLRRMTRDTLIQRKDGEVPTTLVEGSQPVSGTEGDHGKGKKVPVTPGEEKRKAPSTRGGKDKAVKRKRKIKAGLSIFVRPIPDVKQEAWCTAEGEIIVNMSFPSYRKAEKMKSKDYHILRCAIEALLGFAAQHGIVTQEVFEDYRSDVFAKWGEI